MRASEHQHFQPHPESEHFTGIAAVDTFGVGVVDVMALAANHRI